MKFLYRSLIFSLICYLPLSSYGQVTLPWTEGFENVGPVTTFYNDSYPINGLPNWSYDEANFKGRLRFQAGSGFYHSGTKAATLDKISTSYYQENANFLILELDLSYYTLSTDLALSFYHMHHSDLYLDAYDKVWIRGSNKDKWVQIYNLVTNQGSAGSWRYVSELDIDQKLAQANPPQKVSSTFQLRFGQHGYNTTVSTEYYQGRTFDDITITGTHCGHPPVFEAENFSSNSVILNWTKNVNNHDVLIAVNTINTFGNPVNGVSYSQGNSIPGGGTVIYAGSELSFLHQGLNPNNNYYYKAWSFSGSYQYSCGIQDNVLTPCASITSFPYTQNFENGGAIPSCWRQEYISGDNEAWVFTQGNRGKAHPTNAHSGNYNACLQDTDPADDITLLVTPPFDLSLFSTASISFWHTQEVFFSEQDELKVYYRTSANGEWQLLASYTASLSSWTNETVILPNMSSACYVAFSGNAKYGYGICIDDFSINGTLVTHPIADFSASTTTPAIGQTVLFTDLSINTPTSWIWSFDPGTVNFVNGTDANSQHPEVQFTESGNYTVELTATNANGSDVEIKVDYITVLPKPEADFEVDILTPAIGQTVTFTDLSLNDPTSWLWSFNPETVIFVNGTNATSQHPEVQFAESGNYTVELTASNASGNDTETKTDYISVLPKPETDFEADILTPAIGQTVTFTDLSLNDPTSWLWSFNPETVIFVNGTNATSQKPEVQFTESGNYTVELTASNASGNDTETKTDYISVLPKPETDFEADILTPAIGQTVTFTDLSLNDPTSWLWSFNPETVIFVNGTNATSQHPEVQFTESGNYTVELTASNASGNDIETKTDYISVLPKPDADFEADILTPAIGQTVTFADLSLNDPTSWLWSFNPETVIFVNGTNATSQHPEVQFTESGNYTVELTASNASGNDIETKTDYISVLPKPDADFEADILTPAIGQTVTFADLSLNDPTSWLWSFNPETVIFVNGTNATSQHPEVQFTESGNYTVELTASNASGFDIEIKVNYITVHNPELIIDLKVYLEGSFAETAMNPNITEFIPLSQPYNIQPWYYNGDESVIALPDPLIIDWVLVELRDATEASLAVPSTMINRQSAFLLSNGKIVGMDGTSSLHFDNTLENDLFVVIWHRNHLGIMSSGFLTETGGIYSYDFTDNLSKVYSYSHNGMKEIGAGIWGMIGGDGDRNGIINDLDKTVIWQSQSGFEGYLESDYNLDKQSNNADKNDIWIMNYGIECQVPQ